MKSILYIGATLMIGASIYGFVDYKKTNQNKEFRNLYGDTPAQPAVSETTVLAEPSVIPAKKEETRIVAGEKKSAKASATNSKKAVSKKVKQERKLNHKAFSRAALREFELPEVPETPVIKKTEITEEAPEKK